jgi:hypothetical protein
MPQKRQLHARLPTWRDTAPPFSRIYQGGRFGPDRLVRKAETDTKNTITIGAYYFFAIPRSTRNETPTPRQRYRQSISYPKTMTGQNSTRKFPIEN